MTREEVAAIVKVEPTGEQNFSARFSLRDGSEKVFSIAGDQLYIDAHILKRKPLANIFGLHTSYELDRVAGRYALLNDETTKVRTVYSLSKYRPLDIFDLRRRFAFLNPLLDAEYGSATFISSDRTEELRVMVSTTGLLVSIRNRNYRKPYAIDWALACAVAPAGAVSPSRKLENAVFVELKRRGNDVCYLNTRKSEEIDFVAVSRKMRGAGVPELIQVCMQVENQETLEREIKGLPQAASFIGTNHATLVTMDDERTIEKNGCTINIVPAWKWFL